MHTGVAARGSGLTGFGDAAVLKPMTLEAFKASGILKVLTPTQAVDMFNTMLAKTPVEHS